MFLFVIIWFGGEVGRCCGVVCFRFGFLYWLESLGVLFCLEGIVL